MSQEPFDTLFTGKLTLTPQEQDALRQHFIQKAKRAEARDSPAAHRVTKPSNSGAKSATTEKPKDEIRGILVPRKMDVSRFTSIIFGMMPTAPNSGVGTFYAQDALVNPSFKTNLQQSSPHERPNLPPNMPPYRLVLKIGQPAILVANLDPEIGLCSGARVLVGRMSAKGVEVVPLSGEYKGYRVSLPRIPFMDLCDGEKQPGVDTVFQRLQFPLRPIFAETIGHSQGYAFDYAGVDPSNVPLARGALCVALSRNMTPGKVKVLCSVDGVPGTVRVKD